MYQPTSNLIQSGSEWGYEPDPLCLGRRQSLYTRPPIEQSRQCPCPLCINGEETGLLSCSCYPAQQRISRQAKFTLELSSGNMHSVHISHTRSKPTEVAIFSGCQYQCQMQVKNAVCLLGMDDMVQKFGCSLYALILVQCSTL